jgi:iron complex transport system substrate-binding protein
MMEKKYRLYIMAMAVITIVAIATAVGTYVYYQGQISSLKTENLLETLVDDTGFVLNLTSYPERIVSLAPSNTEILFAMGAGDKVVGVTDYDNYPYNFSAWIEAGNMTSIGGAYNPAIEPIVALQPDLVLAFGGPGGSLDAIDKLRNVGYNVLTLDPKDVSGVIADIVMVGRATGHNTQAASVATNISQRIEAVVNAVKKASSTPKVYCEVWIDPYMSVGPKSWISSLITLVGGQNIFENATNTYYPVVSSEAIIQQNPDVMVFVPQGGQYFWGSLNDVANRTGWNIISAVKNNRMYVTPEGIVEKPGPRTADAVEILAKIIHPEIFGNYTGP